MLARVTPLHLDAHLIAVDKPAGLLAVPGRTEPDCLAARVQAVWPDALVVHRLDMVTSGLMLFARGATAQRRLGDAFAQRRVHKRYVAIACGLPDADAGEIDLPLAADWPRRPLQRVDHEHGRQSLTRWRVLARDTAGSRTRVLLEPVSGRSHQLRVHLQAIGHPIVGDALYGGAPAARLMLHAAELIVPHPADGRELELSSTPPF